MLVKSLPPLITHSHTVIINGRIYNNNINRSRIVYIF